MFPSDVGLPIEHVEYLPRPDPDSTWSVHPFSGGYTEFASLGMYASRGWGAALNLSLPAGGNVIFNAPDGERVITWEALSPTPGAALTLTGDQLPAGQWQVQAGKFALHHTYQGAAYQGAVSAADIPLGRLSLGKSETPPRLVIDLRTEMITLEPGESIATRQVLWIVQT